MKQLYIAILQGKFGKTQQIISANMDELLRLLSCSGDCISQLCSIYDTININICDLESLVSNLINIIWKFLDSCNYVQVTIRSTSTSSLVNYWGYVGGSGTLTNHQTWGCCKGIEWRYKGIPNPKTTKKKTLLPSASTLIADDHSEAKKVNCVFVRKNIIQLPVKVWLPTRMPFWRKGAAFCAWLQVIVSVNVWV